MLKFGCSLLLCTAALCASAHADRVEPLIVPSQGRTGFTRLPSDQTGIQFANQLSEDRSATNRNLLSGSGVAAGDVNGDGHIDLFFCALDNDNALYFNRGSWRFEERAVASGVACPGWDSTGAAFADVDGDGDLDLVLNNLGKGTHLFVNDGSGVFTRRQDSGLRSDTGSTSLALADIDGDSDLDLYVTNFRIDTIRDRPQTKFSFEYVNQQPVVARVDGRSTTSSDLTNRFALAPNGEIVEFGEPDVLYENDGTGRFKVVPFNSGRFHDEEGSPLRAPPGDWGLSVQFHDFTSDGAPDIYVCNDYWTPDRIWINDGKGSFRAAPSTSIRSTSRSSMGVDFADVNRDGYPDCIVVDMFARKHRDRQIQVGEMATFSSVPAPYQVQLQISQNTLQLNRGDGTFAQVGAYCGVEGSEWSWSPAFIDVDLDGWEDLLVSNGHRRNFLDADAGAAIQRGLAGGELSFNQPARIMSVFPRMDSANALFRNNKDLTFTDKTEEWGFAATGISHGLCLADLDNDGDLDVAMNDLGTAAGIYRNDSTAPRISVRLNGRSRNTSGVGALLTLTSGQFTQSQEIIAGGRYLSGDALERVFAVPLEGPHSLKIKWRDGSVKTIRNIHPNHRYVIAE